MALVCEEIREGDKIGALDDKGCCWRVGQKFVIKVEDDGALYFDAACNARYYLSGYLSGYLSDFEDIQYSFDLIPMGGPW